MKCIFWNFRGFANPSTRLVLKRFCVSHNPDFVFISEPWMDIDQLPANFWSELGLRIFAVNSRNDLILNLWCVRASKWNPSVIQISDQFVSFSIMMDGHSIGFAAIYAACTYIKRRELWTGLSSLLSNTMLWCFIGDYNVVLGSHEYRGSGSPSRIACSEFQNWSDGNQLIHLPTRGAFYSWSNGRKGRACTEKRLDRSVCNQEWIKFWSSVSCCTLLKSKSDHFPLLLDMKREVKQFASSFKFMRIWSSHPNCKSIVQDVWNDTIIGSPMVVLSQKLKNLNNKLKEWNKSVFGHVNANVQAAMPQLEGVQQQIDTDGYSDLLMGQEKAAQVELEKALTFQEQYWQEKSRVQWHSYGDRNTQFFHKMTKLRNVTKQISQLKSGDLVLDNFKDIEQHEANYFENIFSRENEYSDNGLIEDDIPHSVFAADNVMLTNIPSLDEVKQAAFSMNSNGALGPDGFGAFLFQEY